MTIAYVGLGANLGAREETLRRAVELLGAADGVNVLAVSQLRETVEALAVAAAVARGKITA